LSKGSIVRKSLSLPVLGLGLAVGLSDFRTIEVNLWTIDTQSINTLLKCTFNGLQFCRCPVYFHWFSRCWLPNLRNSKRIQTYSRSKSSILVSID